MKLLVRLFGKNAFVQGSPYEKKVDYNNYYYTTKVCNNCQSIILIYVKKGVCVNDIITKVKCNDCECRLEK